MSVFVVTFFYDIISRTRFVCTLFLLLNLINRKISVYTKHMTSKVEPIRNNSLHFVQKKSLDIVVLSQPRTPIKILNWSVIETLIYRRLAPRNKIISTK
jgi:hypothetical protein